jgi:phosphoserine phosphatase RsbU/P
MAEIELKRLQHELRFRKLQMDSIYELASALQTSQDIDGIMRLFFSVVMGPLGLSRAFFFHREHGVFRKKGYKVSAAEQDRLERQLRGCCRGDSIEKVADIPDSRSALRELLLAKGIHQLLNISDNRKKTVILGLGLKFNRLPVSDDDVEYILFLSRFALIAIDNARYLEQMLEKKRMESEMRIARQIQQSLLPQQMPPLAHYDLAVVYMPIQDVGGDYYDMPRRRKHLQSMVLADVEGKGLSAALLAASSQAIFHTLNELYFFRPSKFIAKANQLIAQFTRGQRFITLFWMILNDEAPALTYVNAGHVHPFVLSGKKIRKLERGGVPIGFSDSSVYEEETVPLQPGDIVCVFTDGVHEVENTDNVEFGEKAVIDHVAANRRLPAQEIADGLYRRIREYAGPRRFRDDFTVLIIKTREGVS